METLQTDIGKHVRTEIYGNGVIVALSNYGATILLDNETPYEHNGESSLNHNVTKGMGHPWDERLFYTDRWTEINPPEPEKTIKVNGKDYSESTIKSALKSYIGD